LLNSTRSSTPAPTGITAARSPRFTVVWALPRVLRRRHVATIRLNVQPRHDRHGRQHLRVVAGHHLDLERAGGPGRVQPGVERGPVGAVGAPLHQLLLPGAVVVAVVDDGLARLRVALVELHLHVDALADGTRRGHVAQHRDLDRLGPRVDAHAQPRKGRAHVRRRQQEAQGEQQHQRPRRQAGRRRTRRGSC
jgi:hypothetical protein